MARVLIGCETSGIVRDAFLSAGHDCWSCDVLPADTPTNRHIQDDVRNVIQYQRWDFMAVMHPPCTRLCASGVRWLHEPPEGKTLAEMWRDLDAGCALFSELWNCDIPLIAMENPVMHKHAKERIANFPQGKPHQTVQPWQFATSDTSADNVKKRTCFWLRGLPQLQTTGTLDGSTARDECHKAAPSADRWKIRSKFYHGIAAAMAEQWGAIAQASPAAA